MSHQLMNCAAEVCCPPEVPLEGQAPPYNMPAHRARVELLVGLGVPDELAHKVSRAMVEKGMVFLTQEMADAIRHVAFPEHTKT